MFFTRPDQRVNRFTSKFIPRVRPAVNKENINSGTIEETIEEETQKAYNGKFHLITAEYLMSSEFTEVNLSGSEAENIFNSLFPDVAEGLWSIIFMKLFLFYFQFLFI